jgi:hypothetical protein
MTKRDIKGLIGLIIVIFCLMVLPKYDPNTAPKFQPDNSPYGWNPL